MPKIVKMSKSTAEARLASVPCDRRFWCHDGRVFENMEQLRSAFEDMGEDTYRYHANEEKNDFSSWIEIVIGDDKLARDLRKSHDCVQAARRVRDRIAFLRTRAVE